MCTLVFWYQHLTWILGLRPGPSGTLRPTQQASDNLTSLNNAVTADLPMLASMLSRLFESSQYVLWNSLLLVRVDGSTTYVAILTQSNYLCPVDTSACQVSK